MEGGTPSSCDASLLLTWEETWKLKTEEKVEESLFSVTSVSEYFIVKKLSFVFHFAFLTFPSTPLPLVILPPSALHVLIQQRIQYPMLFRLQCHDTQLITHCGVLQFDAEEGQCVMPAWMMRSIGVEERGIVSFFSVSLPKATFVRLQPHQGKFLSHLSNPRVVMETALRNFATLTLNEV